MLSILHRITGFGLAVGAPLLVCWLMSAIKSEEAFAQFHDFARTITGKFFLLGWLFAFVYHFLNGIRHLVWDTGYWLTLKSAYASGYAVFFGAIILTAFLWNISGGKPILMDDGAVYTVPETGAQQ